MKNKKLRTPADLLVAAALAEAGVTANGAVDGVSQNTAARINTERTAAITAGNAYEEAKTVLRQNKLVMDVALEECRKFLLTGRDILKPHLGTQYSQAWDATGLRGSLAMPETADAIQSCTESFKDYFTANADHENADLEITAANATTLLANVVAARAAVNTQKAIVGNLIQVRDQKLDKLRTRIRGLVSELGQLLDPMSAGWKAYGFNVPGAMEMPEEVENVSAILIGPTAASVKWDASARAEYYRVWMKVHGSEGDYLPVGSPADLDFTLENLPANSQIDIVVSAVNNGGETQMSDVITITTTA